MKYIITRASIINRVSGDGKLHFFFTEKEKPCEEAVLEELLDDDGAPCSRYFVELHSIEELNELGEKYNCNVIVTNNINFPDFIALVLDDEEIDMQLQENQN